jgi:hypothetical protein
MNTFKHFGSQLWRRFFQTGTRSRSASRSRAKARLAVEALDERTLLSVSPAGPAFDVFPHGTVGGITSDRIMARASDGLFGVVGANQQGIFFQLYDANGSLRASRQIEGTDNLSDQPTIAMNFDGRFAVAWTQQAVVLDQNGNPRMDNNGQPVLTRHYIYTERFDANGDQDGHLNPVTFGYTDAYNPSIALNDNGQLVVAYNERNDPAISGQGSDLDIYEDLWFQGGVDQKGTLMDGGSGFGFRGAPSVALNNNNQGALAYVIKDATGTGLTQVLPFTVANGIHDGRLLLHHGPAESTDLNQVDPTDHPKVAINRSGDIVVARTQIYWSEPGFRGDIVDQQVIVNLFAPDMTQLTEQQVLNVELSKTSPYSSREYRPAVALDGAGRFVVSATQDLYELRLQGDALQVSQKVVAQVFDQAGNPLSSHLDMSSTDDNPMTHIQDYSSVAVDGAGNFVVAYKDGTPGNDGVMARLFNQTSDNNGIVGDPQPIVGPQPIVAPTPAGMQPIAAPTPAMEVVPNLVKKGNKYILTVVDKATGRVLLTRSFRGNVRMNRVDLDGDGQLDILVLVKRGKRTQRYGFSGSNGSSLPV